MIRENIYRKSLLGVLQHLISIVIVSMIVMSLIPGYYSLFNNYFVFLILIQMLFSASKFRIINLFLETIILVFAVIGFVPYLGWFFRFLALPFSLFDMASFGENVIYKKVEVFTSNSVKDKYKIFKNERTEKRRENRDEKIKEKKKEKERNIVDVEFKEK